MSTVTLQGDLSTDFSYTGHITQEAGSKLQVPIPQRYTQMSKEDLATNIRAAREKLGSRLVILGHHYQRDDVIQWADIKGDSYKLCKDASARPEAEYIIFCGVHFMAEAADILSAPHQKVILPDLHAGCSMADMADIDQVEEAWEALTEACPGQTIIPITYMNSSASLKAFVGRNGGSVCTSSNADKVMDWALRSKDKGGAGGHKLLFFPDQHLGRNTAVLEMGFSLDDCIVWDPSQDLGGQTEEKLQNSPILLWKGHCSVHGTFMPIHVKNLREQYPDIKIISHPECTYEVVSISDEHGSTQKIRQYVDAAPAGATIAIGTEIHLVKRLEQEYPDKTILSINPNVCVCSTMFRVDSPHVLWVMENLLEGKVVNQISVPEQTADEAKMALQRMLDLSS